MNALVNSVPDSSLAHDCAQLRDLVARVMMATGARRLTVDQGTNGLMFEVDRRGFDRMFAGLRPVIAPDLRRGDNLEVRKIVQLVPEVLFCCTYEETPEERLARLINLVAPDKRAEFLAHLMEQHGGGGPTTADPCFE